MIKKLVAELESQALADLTKLVDANSFTGNIDGLARVADLIVEIAGNNGMTLKKIPASGDYKGACHLSFNDAEENDFIGVVGHFDTVHPPESPFSKLKDKGDILTGPGVQDMKSGIIAAIYGLRVAREVMKKDRLPVKIVFNCDEETGSIDSRQLIEKTMKGAKAALIFEGRKISDNAVVTSRKGIIMGMMTVKGKEAHAGEAPEEGANAIVEAAHKIIGLNALTDIKKGVIVTTGKITGGKVANQIADLCSSTIDIRFKTEALETDIKAAVGKVMEKVHISGCVTDYTLVTARPAFMKTEASEALRKKYADCARSFGTIISERDAGGGSDGNLTAAIGIPTIDGVGPAGDFPHTDKEYISKASLFDAMKYFALLLTDMFNS